MNTPCRCGECNWCLVDSLPVSSGKRSTPATPAPVRVMTKDLWVNLPDPLPASPLTPVPKDWAHRDEVRAAHISALDELARGTMPRLEGHGSGVVLVGGGRYWPGCVVAVKMLREFSDLPVQIWHRGSAEPVKVSDLDGITGVEVKDSTKVPYRILGGWEAKTLAILHCGWEKVLYLDADAYNVADPAPLFDLVSETNPFVYWQDLPHTEGDVKWPSMGLTGDGKPPQVQGGQLVIHRPGFSRELLLAHWMNQHSDYFYSHQYGDQDAYRVALVLTCGPYQCLGPASWRSKAFVCSHDDVPYIVHRCKAKFFLDKEVVALPQLPGEDRALAHFARLMKKPSLVQKAKNLTSAVVKQVAAGLPRVSDAAYAARMSVCESCEQKSGNSCKLCGCNLSTKARWATQKCPLDKWCTDPTGQSKEKEGRSP